MQDFELESAPSTGGLLGVGIHPVRLESIDFNIKSKVHDDYTDRMQQIGFKFVGENGRIITLYANTYGVTRFKELSEEDQESGQFKASDQGYAVDVATGQRVKNEKRTDACMRIMKNLIHACGVPKGEKAKLSSLPDSILGIEVAENDRGELRVVNTMPIAKVAEVATASV